MQSLPPALSPLGAWSQFVTWIGAPIPDKPGKLNKFPTSWHSGAVIDAQNPANWTNAGVACAVGASQDRGHGAGVGFVFTDTDPFFFLDIDGAWDAHTGQWSPLAQQLVARLGGAAVEVSMSGTGLHIIGRTYKPLEHATKNTLLGLELYTRKRFVALTGSGAQGDVMADCTAPLHAIVQEFFPPSATGDWAGWTMDPVPDYTGPADDEELIRKALASGQRNAAIAFAHGGAGDVGFVDLWTANADVLGKKWPPNKHGQGFDASNADMALANMLAFWTGKNCERMRTLMHRSALNRDKWHVRPTYLPDTIVKACAFVANVYSAKTAPKDPPAPVIPLVAPEVMQAASQTAGRKLRDPMHEYMGPAQQLEHFRGCFFNNTNGKVYSLDRNVEMNKATFDVNYGGHLFVLDPQAQKTTESAFTAFTQSRVNFPKLVDALCFRPELEPGEIVHAGNRQWVNSYVPHHPRVLHDSADKFLNHVYKMLPHGDDALRLLSYMAAMAQNPGRKFQWWPVVQGCEGNGKSLLLLVMAYIMGEEYTHLPNTHKMAKNGSNFNSWIYRKLFIGMEEIMLSLKRDFLDEFKVVITNEKIEVEAKGENQFMGDNRANGILCTNHKDGVPITADTRRYGIFYCAQQSVEHLIQDGMGETYFADLVDWLKGRGAYDGHGANYGLACVAGSLLSMQIPDEMNPAVLALRSPKTTSTAEALMASLGRAEQEINEAIEEGRVGFCGGWVSSFYVDRLLEQLRTHVPRTKRRDLLVALGYDYHPALLNGRANDVVSPDGIKSRLYVKNGHPAATLDTPKAVATAYAKAQEPGRAGPVDDQAAILAFRPLTEPSK